MGEAFFNTNATPGANWYGCVAPNTWAAQSGAGGSGGGATSSSQLADFRTTISSSATLTVAPGVYRLGNVSYPYASSTTFALTQYTITSVTQASQATLTLSSNWATGSVHYGDTISINGAAGAGCSGLNALQTVANLPAPNQITINWNSTGCLYTANSAQFGANPAAAGTAYLFGDYAGNLTLEMPAAAGLIPVGSGAITPVVIQDSTPGFDPSGIPIASITISAAGNGSWGSVTDARGFMSATSLVAGAGMSINEAGGVWTLGIDQSVVPELGGGNTWTGANDFSAANSTAPMKVASTAPVTCSTGQYYFNRGSGHTYACTAPNTWTQVDGGGGGGGGATIPSTTNLIKGDGAGNGADSGIAPSSVELTSHKDAASGYAGLDPGGLLKASEMPNPS
ncbi:MAG TPA: hypothetical protein VKV74_01835, partial [Bryobacteraceae bacterium]|nr:hypothetical protein [Bryobacteraceae bacterium]